MTATGEDSMGSGWRAKVRENRISRIGWLAWSQYRRWRWRRGIQKTAKQIDRYDELHNVSSLSAHERELLFSRGLVTPVLERNLRAGLDLVTLDRNSAWFVDIGSGRGKAMLHAMEAGFKKLWGIEIDAEANDAAKQNFRTYRPAVPADVQVTLLAEDALTAELPEGDLLVFMCNPFHGDVMVRFMARLEGLLEKSPRRLWIVYINPECHDIVSASPSISLVSAMLLPGPAPEQRVYTNVYRSSR
jgi:hypothetical protein